MIFPSEVVTYYQFTTIYLYDNYLLLRQTTAYSLTDGPRESVYYFSKDILPQLVLQRNITDQPSGFTFYKALIV